MDRADSSPCRSDECGTESFGLHLIYHIQMCIYSMFDAEADSCPWESVKLVSPLEKLSVLSPRG